MSASKRPRCKDADCQAFARIGEWCIAHHVVYGPIKEAEARLDKIAIMLPKAEESLKNWQAKRDKAAASCREVEAELRALVKTDPRPLAERCSALRAELDNLKHKKSNARGDAVRAESVLRSVRQRVAVAQNELRALEANKASVMAATRSNADVVLARALVASEAGDAALVSAQTELAKELRLAAKDRPPATGQKPLSGRFDP
jgi:chromosome segregation ATPase